MVEPLRRPGPPGLAREAEYTKAAGTMGGFLRRHFIMIGIAAGAVSGGAVGALFPSLGVEMGFLGHLFLNALKMIALPLIVVSITLSVVRIGGPRDVGSLGAKTVLYYTVTTAAAAAIGITAVEIIKPGLGAVRGTLPAGGTVAAGASFSEIVLSFVTPNLFESAAKFEVLPLIMASLLFGLALAAYGGRGTRTVEEMLTAVDGAIAKMVEWVLYLAPVGVMALIAERVGAEGGAARVAALVTETGRYVATVVAGLLVHGLLVLPVLLYLFTGRNPLRLASHMGKALLTAFSTASSSATLPLTLNCAEQNAGLPQRVSRFVLPLGATVNMDGTALYEAVAAVFIAQSYGIELGGWHLVVIFVTATLAAVGAAGIPEAGLTTMVLVLTAVGLPVEGIGMLLAGDWLLDRFRTTVNVWGDCVGAAVLTRWEGGGSEEGEP